MRGKLLVIEGTEGSGKETQADLLVKRLNEMGEKAVKMRFPMYDTPTGKIIYEHILNKDGNSYFDEEVDPKALSLYYAADRVNNIGKINELLDKGVHVVLDRYVESNMAHQGGKLKTREERERMYQKLDELEFGIMELPRPDAVIFLYMPFEYAAVLKKNREETPDQHESNKAHLEQAEKAYLELTEKYGYIKVTCVKDDCIRTIDDINDEVVEKIKDIIK